MCVFYHVRQRLLKRRSTIRPTYSAIRVHTRTRGVIPHVIHMATLYLVIQMGNRDMRSSRNREQPQCLLIRHAIIVEKHLAHYANPD